MHSNESIPQISLDDIPKIGPKLKEKLLERFGSEEAALHAIINADIARLTSIPLLGSKLAMSIVMATYALREGISLETVLVTEDIRKIYTQLLNLIRPYANTSFTRHKMALLFPLPPSHIDKILERQKTFLNAKELIEELGENETTRICSLLSRLKPIETQKYKSRITDRILLTDDKATYERLKGHEINKVYNISFVEAPQEYLDYVQTYDFIIFIAHKHEHDFFDNASNVEIVSKDISEDKLLPEKTLSFFASNYNVILAACDLIELFSSLSNDKLNDIVNQFDLQQTSTIKTLMKNIKPSGDIAEEYDPEMDRLRGILREFDGLVSDIELWINNELVDKLSKSSLTIEGSEILNLVKAFGSETGSPQQFQHYLKDNISDLMTEIIQEAEDKLCNQLQFKDEEVEWLDDLFPRELMYPVEINSKKRRQVIDNIRKKFAARKFQLLKKLADDCKTHIPFIHKMVETLLDFDLFFAIGRFAKEYQLVSPNIDIAYTGVGFQKGTNLFLKKEELEGKGKVIPIDYVIGDVPFSLEGTNQQRIAILSGANSGGKSCTLQLISQIVILAQMGLPAPSEIAFASIFEEIYYFSKSIGMLSAGAFEATLKRFAEVILSPKSKLILVDEFESITEPGAGAKVIGGILEMLYKNEKCCAVFVSHLASEISQTVKNLVRIDGIEASGLDENLELIVNRTPKFNHLAKSTPELIVEKLYRSTNHENERDIYEELLNIIKSS
ncbi:MAG: helix-hairpin-helix domain-containing protein [Promethearchaeota archaeon]